MSTDHDAALDLGDPGAVAAVLAPGARLRAVLAGRREGRITDFHWELA
jgi:hypothetical protein